MRLFSRMLLTTATLVMLVAPVAAQLPGIGTGLVDLPDVQKELNLTSDQKDKMKKAQQTARAALKDDFDKLKDLPQQQRFVEVMKLNQKVNAEAAKEYNKILNDDQKKRLKQIEVQTKGIGAFTDPDVSKELKLTDDQKQEVAKIAQEMATEMEKIAKDAQEAAQKGNLQAALESVKKVQDASKKGTQKAVDALDADQKKKWKELTGTPFEMKLQFPGLGGLGK